MKYVVVLVSALLLHASTALAQEEAETVAEPTTEGGSATQPAEPATKKRSVYYRKARGWLWIEGLIGVSAYDPDQFGSLSAAAIENAPRLKGPEYGFAVGTPFGGPFFLGFFYRQASYGQYKLLKTGLDMQGSIMIPYVHIILRGSIGYAKTFKGNPYGLENVDNGGVAFTGGFGVRIPIIFEIYNDAMIYEDHRRSRWIYPQLKEEQRADQCNKCGECTEVCPQEIDIPGWLEKAHAFLAPEEESGS